jgi:hypothetical protein
VSDPHPWFLKTKDLRESTFENKGLRGESLGRHFDDLFALETTGLLIPLLLKRKSRPVKDGMDVNSYSKFRIAISRGLEVHVLEIYFMNVSSDLAGNRR